MEIVAKDVFADDKFFMNLASTQKIIGNTFNVYQSKIYHNLWPEIQEELGNTGCEIDRNYGIYLEFKKELFMKGYSESKPYSILTADEIKKLEVQVLASRKEYLKKNFLGDNYEFQEDKMKTFSYKDDRTFMNLKQIKEEISWFEKTIKSQLEGEDFEKATQTKQMYKDMMKYYYGIFNNIKSQIITNGFVRYSDKKLLTDEEFEIVKREAIEEDEERKNREYNQERVKVIKMADLMKDALIEYKAEEDNKFERTRKEYRKCLERIAEAHLS